VLRVLWEKPDRPGLWEKPDLLGLKDSRVIRVKWGLLDPREILVPRGSRGLRGLPVLKEARVPRVSRA
jgi:hypothetical protein